MRILLRPNLEKKDSVPCTDRTVKTLLELDAIPMLDERFRPLIGQYDGCIFGRFTELLDSCDVLMPIGGDGTLLHAVRHAVRKDKPVIGINTGRVGFLTQIEGWELERLALLVRGEYQVEERMLLRVEVDAPEETRQFMALNDIIVTRDKRRLAEIGVYCGDRMLARYRADGLILSTPTGSTGYTVSAGGSVIDPSLSLISMTAICPYAAYNRSLILPADQVYTVRLDDEVGGEKMAILADGEEISRIQIGQSVRVSRSSQVARLIDLGIRDFYSNLREKLLLRR